MNEPTCPYDRALPGEALRDEDICPYCSGEKCWQCEPRHYQPPCHHDVMDRHPDRKPVFADFPSAINVTGRMHRTRYG